MYETIDEGYKKYLNACEKHMKWLTDQFSTKFKCFLFYLGTGIERNGGWIRQLQAVEIALGLSEEEKQSHRLEE